MSSATLNDIVSRRPNIRSIAIPEVKKRKEPNKFYVYKILVEWSNGTKTVVYRRYSAFFDFNIKLLELYSNLCERNPSFEAHIPELPGKILFGRSQIHQVAEKRRGKIEEYSQQLLSLPVELSSSGVVLGFFSTWQDDTAFPADQSSSSAADRPPSPLSAATFSLPSVAPAGTLAAGSALFSASIAPSVLPAFPVIHVGGQATDPLSFGHADEMENLEQYKVIADYERKDNHQITLHAGQVVHVIEKHDTGWWMVMADDEQGYAPAAHLEPLEGSPYDHLALEDAGSSRGYEALENYIPQSEDEVGFKAGDKIEVITKSMDGWWKIRVNNKVGLSPSTLIHKATASSPVKPDTADPLYETGDVMYEGLHVHRPPPRRNTVSKRGDIDIYGSLPDDIYALPRTENVWIKTAGGDDDNTSDLPNGAQYYKVPRSVPASAEDLAKLNSPQKEEEGPKSCRTSGGVTTVPEEGEEEEEEGPAVAGKGLASTNPLPGREHLSAERKEGPAVVGKGPALAGLANPLSGRERLCAEGKEGPAVVGKGPALAGPSAGEPRGQTSSPAVSAQGKGKVEADEYVYMADQESGGDGVGVTATLPASSSQMASRHPLNPAPSTRARSLSEDRLLSDTTVKKVQTPPPSRPLQAHPPRPLQAPPQAPPQFPDEYVDMSNNDDDPTYAVPPDAVVPDDDCTEGPPHFTPGPPPSIRSQALTQSRPDQSSPRLPTQGVTQRRSSGSTGSSGSSGSSPTGVRKDPSQAPPMKAPKPMNKIKVGDAIVEVESKADLHNELREKFGRKSKSSGNLDTPLTPKDDASDGKAKPTVKKRALFGSKNVESNGMPASPSHKPLEHTISSPIPLTSEGGAPRMFVAHCDYTSQTEGCLSFSKGDRCVLVKNTPGGWWMVSINGKEGWTPSDYWDEDIKAQTRSVRPLPEIPPQPTDKKSKDAKGVTAANPVTTTEPVPLTPTTLNSPAVGTCPGPIPPPSVDSDRQPSNNNAELKRAGPSMSGIRGKPSVPPPFKKSTPEKPSPPVKVKPSGALPGVGTAPLIRNGEVSAPAVSRNGEPPGPFLPGDKNGKGEVGDEWQDDQGVLDSEYSLLADVNDSSDFRNAPWFVGKMEREKAEQVLKEYGRQRDFLVRERVGKDGYFAISIRHHYSFKHFNIDPVNDGKYSMGPLVFGSLEEIVAHYQVNSLFIHDGQHVTLGQPVKLKNRAEKPFVN